MQLPSPASMVFQLHAKSTGAGRSTFSVGGDNKTKLQNAIADAINQRLKNHKLEFLLVGSVSHVTEVTC